MVWDIKRGEVGGFSRLEIEFSFQVSSTQFGTLYLSNHAKLDFDTLSKVEDLV